MKTLVLRKYQAHPKYFFFFFFFTRIPNPITNRIERNIAKDEQFKDIRYLYKPKNGCDNEDDIAYKRLRDIRTLFEPEEKYYESIRIGYAFSSNYVKCESKMEIKAKR